MISITKDILKMFLVLDSQPLSVLVQWHLVVRIRQAKCLQFQLCYHPLSGCPHSGRTPGAGPEGPHYGAAVRYLPHTTSSSGIARQDCNNAKNIAFTGKNPRIALCIVTEEVCAQCNVQPATKHWVSSFVDGLPFRLRIGHLVPQSARQLPWSK